MIYPRAGTRVLSALPAIKGYTSYIIRIVLIRAQIVSESVRDKAHHSLTIDPIIMKDGPKC